MWQNTQLPVICEDNRPHFIFSWRVVPPCLPHLPSVPLCSPCLHTLPMSSCLIAPVWCKGMDSGVDFCKAGNVCERGIILFFFFLCYNQIKIFHWNFLVYSGTSRGLVLFQHVHRIYWCKHAWRLGALAEGHFRLVLALLWTAPETFRFLKRMQTSKWEAREKSSTEWTKTQFWFYLRKCLTTEPQITQVITQKAPWYTHNKKLKT